MIGGSSVETIIAQMPKLLKLIGRLHMLGSKVLIKHFGSEGEKSVRRWCRIRNRDGSGNGDRLCTDGHLCVRSCLGGDRADTS